MRLKMETLKAELLSDLQSCLEVKWYRGRCVLICVEFEPPSQRYETITWSIKRKSSAVTRTHYDDYDHSHSTKVTTFNECMTWKELKTLIADNSM